MHLLRWFLPFFVIAFYADGAGTRTPPAPPRPRPASLPAAGDLLERLPLRFEANQGQFHPSVKFYSRGARFGLWLTSTEALVSVSEQGRSRAIRMSWKGGNPHPEVEAIDPVPSTSNYFYGQQRKAWRTNVAQYSRVRYKGVYPGIDLVYYGTGQELEYDFVLSPGAKPRQIRLRFKGADKLSIDQDGSLILHVGETELRQMKPKVYQRTASGTETVGGEYVLLGSSEVGFRLGPYDRAKALIIDPVLDYSTYLGRRAEVATGVATDNTGHVWVVGYVTATDFPTAGEPYKDAQAGGLDVFVTRLDPSAPPDQALIYSTYIGGTGDEEPAGVATDSFGNLWVCGYTSSIDFPYAGNPPQTTTAGDKDAFVMRISSTYVGFDSLEFSTYLGGDLADFGTAITVGSNGKVYVVGYTESGTFPVIGEALQNANRGGWEAWLSVYDAQSGSLEYSTNLGGDKTDIATAVAADGTGMVYIAGYTLSDDFPIAGDVYRGEPAGGGDIFFTQLNLNKPGLDSLVYSTYLGGSAFDAAYGMIRDSNGVFYLTGYTLSADFPLAGLPYRTTNAGNADVFLIKFNPSLPGDQGLIYSTYLGGSGGDVGYGIAMDAAGLVYIAGYTASNDFPVKGDQIQGTFAGGGTDAFLVRLDPAAQGDASLVDATYFGGSGMDAANGIALDGAGNVYLAGFTLSADLPIAGNSYQPNLLGVWNAFVVRYRP